MRGPIASTEGLDVRHPTAEDEAAFLAAARASRGLHGDWLTPPTTPAAWAAYVDKFRRPEHHGFLFWRRGSATLVGLANISNVIMGGFRSAHLGYGAFAGATGEGLMTEAVDWVVDHAFTDLGLHRLEANIQPGNETSLALARRCGFRKEGFSPNYLTVAGAWRDHERWAITVEDRAGSAGP